MVTPNNYCFSFNVPNFVSQQDEEINITSLNIKPDTTGDALSFISQEVNSSEDGLPTVPSVIMANRVTSNVLTMFSQDAVNQVTAVIYYDEGEEKSTPRRFITAGSGHSFGGNSYDVEVEHLCVPVVYPTTGETIT